MAYHRGRALLGKYVWYNVDGIRQKEEDPKKFICLKEWFCQHPTRPVVWSDWIHPQFPFNTKLMSGWEECPICLESKVKSMILLYCGHMFCASCISCMKQCALCREEISEKINKTHLTIHCKQDQIWLPLPLPSLQSSDILSYIKRWMVNHFGCISLICSSVIMIGSQYVSLYSIRKPVSSVSQIAATIIVSMLALKGRISQSQLQAFFHWQWDECLDLNPILQKLEQDQYIRLEGDVIVRL